MSNGKVLTLDNVASTQDAALEHQLQAGDVCRSFNQTAGRGRRGAAWVASGGVAVTVVLEHAAPHLPIAIAATLASHLNNLIPRHKIGIKWPNDLYVNDKKLAGILIEQREGKCFVGVGVNVTESPHHNAISKQELGFEGTLEDVADVVARSVFEATKHDENEAVTAWSQRDILVGSTQTIQSGNERVEGLVLHIDPCHRLVLQTADGVLAIPAATSTVVTCCK